MFVDWAYIGGVGVGGRVILKLCIYIYIYIWGVVGGTVTIV